MCERNFGKCLDEIKTFYILSQFVQVYTSDKSNKVEFAGPIFIVILESVQLNSSRDCFLQANARRKVSPLNPKLV
jgi:hypothetical protein